MTINLFANIQEIPTVEGFNQFIDLAYGEAAELMMDCIASQEVDKDFAEHKLYEYFLWSEMIIGEARYFKRKLIKFENQGKQLVVEFDDKMHDSCNDALNNGNLEDCCNACFHYAANPVAKYYE